VIVSDSKRFGLQRSSNVNPHSHSNYKQGTCSAIASYYSESHSKVGQWHDIITSGLSRLQKKCPSRNENNIEKLKKLHGAIEGMLGTPQSCAIYSKLANHRTDKIQIILHMNIEIYMF